MANTRYGRLLPPNYGDGKNEWDLTRNDSTSSFQLFVFVKFFASRFRALYKNEKDIWHVTLDKIVERTVKLNLNAPFARLYLCVIQSFVSLFPWFVEKKMYFHNRYKIQRTSLSLSTARFNSFWRTPSVNILLNNYEQLFTTIRLLRYHNERFFFHCLSISSVKRGKACSK